MSAFAVILHDDEPEANEKIRKRIEDEFPDADRFEFSEYVYFVTGVRLVDEVKNRLGLGNDDMFGVVLRLNGSFGGRSWPRLWDWFKAAEELR